MTGSRQFSYFRKDASFTILELVIVIGVLGILGAVALVILNPVELFSQARDSNRVTEIQNINKAIQLYQILVGTSIGSGNIVYISTPDSSPTCANLTLPSLPSGWSYQCKTVTDYRKIDGTGWIPVNFSSINAGSPFSALPVDPSNVAAKGLYYIYINGGVLESWELVTLLQSDKYLQKYAGVDNGSDASKFETGTDLTLWSKVSGLVAYWKFDGNASDSSTSGNNGSVTNSPPFVAGQVNQAISLNGSNQYIDIGNPASLQITGAMTIATWVYIKNFNDKILVTKSGLTPTDQDVGWFLEAKAPSNVTFRIIRVYPFGGHNVTVSVSGNQWVHLVGVFNPTTSPTTPTLKLYVNGQLQSSGGNGVDAQQNSNVNVMVGKNPEDNSYNFNGYLDEVRIHNRALLDTEISGEYNATK